MSNTSVATNSTSAHPYSPPMISDAITVQIITLISIIGGFASIIGTGTNTVNIVIFLKQGLQDSVNISLFSLAISDILSLISFGILALWVSPIYVYSELDVISGEFEYIVGGMFHSTMTRITGWITAFITLERCLCVAIPLKVKSILTIKRVAICMVSVFLIVFISYMPLFYTNQIVWKFFPLFNRTMLGITFTPDRALIDFFVFLFHTVISTFGSFIAVLICTITLVIELKQKTKWRKQATMTSSVKPGEAKSISSKEIKVIRMIVLLSTAFIISSTPTMAFTIWSIADQSFTAVGYNRNIFNVSFSFIFLIEALNSSISMLVYYTMSTKFKVTCREMLPSCLLKPEGEAKK
ncbi:uncharacterized protein LOC131947045 [Physella acuta]|uniref:uncharacterized protein LOC131947045 n=1 Tax=Physella acuta TaxID=109671 RepID=UPI0027DD4A34|nr:uncharacterized protein LOC131947045 [Physella acuta]